MSETSGTRTRRCPVCGSPTVERFRPFCSARCADVDLQRWLSDAYVIPVAEDEDDREGERGDVAGQREPPLL